MYLEAVQQEEQLEAEYHLQLEEEVRALEMYDEGADEVCSKCGLPAFPYGCKGTGCGLSGASGVREIGVDADVAAAGGEPSMDFSMGVEPRVPATVAGAAQCSLPA